MVIDHKVLGIGLGTFEALHCKGLGQIAAQTQSIGRFKADTNGCPHVARFPVSVRTGPEFANKCT